MLGDLSLNDTVEPRFCPAELFGELKAESKSCVRVCVCACNCINGALGRKAFILSVIRSKEPTS